MGIITAASGCRLSPAARSPSPNELNAPSLARSAAIAGPETNPAAAAAAVPAVRVTS